MSEPERFRDQCDADGAALAWLEAIACAAAPPHREINSYGLFELGDGGRVTLFWHNEKLAAATLVVRDGLNFSVLVKWQAEP